MRPWLNQKEKATQDSPPCERNTVDVPSPTSPQRRWSFAQIRLPSHAPTDSIDAPVRRSYTVNVPTQMKRSSTVHVSQQTRHEFLVMQAQKLRSESDISFLLENPEQFAKLKRELRKSGAVTNSVLMHGIHFYARDHGRRNL
jgi:hypothetical protein